MNKSLRILLFCFLFQAASANDMDWGQNGHRVTGEIAQQHLSSKAKKAIEKILNGQSLAMVSTYADEIKSDPRYREFGPWHYVNMAAGETKYNPATANPDGDLLLAMKKCKALLQDKNTSAEDKAFYLKMLVHFVGDLHQPLHTGRGEDKGGNDIQVRWFNDGANLHSVWDTRMIESYNMSYTELASNTPYLSKQQVKQIASGNFDSWMYESKELSKEVYASAEVGEKLGYQYMYVWFPKVMEQLQKGGIRLASVLNDIYK